MPLAADLWTGAGANANWSTGVNWANGVAPCPGDDLVFRPGGQVSNSNDFAAGTQFDLIMLAGADTPWGATPSAW